MFVRVIVYICFRRCWVSLGHIVSLLSVFPFLLSLMHALKSARLTSAHLRLESYRIFLLALGLFPSFCLSDSLLRGSLKGVTAENNAQSFSGEDIDWGARGWRSKAKVGMREWLMVRGETKELIGGNNDQKKDERVKAGMITKDISWTWCGERDETCREICDVCPGIDKFNSPVLGFFILFMTK